MMKSAQQAARKGCLVWVFSLGLAVGNGTSQPGHPEILFVQLRNG